MRSLKNNVRIKQQQALLPVRFIQRFIQNSNI